MWSFNRRTLLMVPLALAACGFQPVYGPGGAGDVLRGRVEVSAPDDVESYWLVQNLEQSLGRTAAAGTDYLLDVKVRTASQGQAITASNDTTRYSIVGTAAYTLTDKESGAVMASGEVRNFTGYSATGSTVDTLAGERDARQRLMVILSDQLVTQLYATLDQPA